MCVRLCVPLSVKSWLDFLISFFYSSWPKFVACIIRQIHQWSFQYCNDIVCFIYLAPLNQWNLRVATYQIPFRTTSKNMLLTCGNLYVDYWWQKSGSSLSWISLSVKSSKLWIQLSVDTRAVWLSRNVSY